MPILCYRVDSHLPVHQNAAPDYADATTSHLPLSTSMQITSPVMMLLVKIRALSPGGEHCVRAAALVAKIKRSEGAPAAG